MQVTQYGGQLWKQCKWRHLVAKVTNASGAMLLLNLVHVTESIHGSVVPLYKSAYGSSPSSHHACLLERMRLLIFSTREL